MLVLQARADVKAGIRPQGDAGEVVSVQLRPDRGGGVNLANAVDRAREVLQEILSGEGKR